MTIFSLRRIVAAVIASALTAGCALAQSSPARPGDRVVIRIFRDSATLVTVDIDPMGNAVLPLAGDVHLAGIPAPAIQDSVRSALKAYVKPSMVQASLERRIAVGGEVFKPGVYYLDWSYAVRDAIAEAGGATVAGRSRNVLLERGGVWTQLKDWRSGSAGLASLESGDRLYVERVSWLERNALQLITAMGVVASVIVSATR